MFEINQNPPLYDSRAVQPMRDELLSIGFIDILVPKKVDEVFEDSKNETVFIIINSVCGCAAGSARPAAALALKNKIIPDKLYSLFAGQEREAVAYFRENYTSEIPPSSPSMFLFKNGELVFNLNRHEIEGRTHHEIAEKLTVAFSEFCSKENSNSLKDESSELIFIKNCGSKIKLNQDKI